MKKTPNGNGNGDGYSIDERARHASDAVRNRLGSLEPNVARFHERRDNMARRARRVQQGVVGIASAIMLVATGSLGVQYALDTGTSGHDSDNRLTSGATTPPFALAGALRPFSACDDALAYFKEHGTTYFTEQDAPVVAADGAFPFPMSERNGLSSAPEAQSSSTSATAHSETNVAEKGVDESDSVKTDGKYLYVINESELIVSDVRQPTPTIVGRVRIGEATSMFLSGDRVVTFGERQRAFNQSRPIPQPALPNEALPSVMPLPAKQFGKTVASIIDVSTPARPIVTESLELDGRFVDARLVDNAVRVVTSFEPDLDVPSPDGESGEKRKQAIDEAVSTSRIENWIPRYVKRDEKGDEIKSGELVACDELARPQEYSGLSTVAVVGFSLDKNLDDVHSAGVIADGSTVYATGTNLYITSTEWTRTGRVGSTSIHQFETNNKDGRTPSATYRGSGRVEGVLNNQYSLSEYDGVLRAATTRTHSVGILRPRTVREGMVTTLRMENNELTEIGRVEGLGREDNESIRSVRFIGALGYVVTFRQTDPLYVIDLRDPKKPVVAGELKISGFSGYLHPVGKDRILGIGQGSDDDESVRTRSDEANAQVMIPPRTDTSHLQMRLFDVSDPAKPRVIDTRTYGMGQAQTTADQKAFLYWEPRNAAIIPAQFMLDVSGKRTGDFNGLVLLEPSNSALREVGRLSFVSEAGWSAQVTRTVVVGDHVYSISRSGVQANSLDTHRPVGSVRF